MAQEGGVPGSNTPWIPNNREIDIAEDDDNEICDILSETSPRLRPNQAASEEIPLVNPKPNKVGPQYPLHQQHHAALPVVHQQNEATSGSNYSQWGGHSRAGQNTALGRSVFSSGEGFQPFRTIPDKSENRDFGRTPGPSKRAPNLSRNSSGDGAFGKAGSLTGPARLSPGPVFAPGLGDVYGGANGQSWIGSAQLYSAADFGLPQTPERAQATMPGMGVGRTPGPPPAEGRAGGGSRGDEGQLPRSMLRTPDLEQQFREFEALSLHQDSPESDFFAAQVQTVHDEQCCTEQVAGNHYIK